MSTILIVEDNEMSRDALARRLERRNYTVLTAVDGHDGVARARAAQPDLILMDLGMPGMDGWDATAQIKLDPETRHIPIIVLSAHAMPNDRHQALAAGGDDFDAKPVQFDRLLGKIEVLLAASRGEMATTESVSGT
jgi:CheY-like chemotaxis protein